MDAGAADAGAADAGAADGGAADGGAADVTPDAGPVDVVIEDVLVADVAVQDVQLDDAPVVDVAITDTPAAADTKADVAAADTKPDPPADVLPDGIGASPCQLNGSLPSPNKVKLQAWVGGQNNLQITCLANRGDGSNALVACHRPGKLIAMPNQQGAGITTTMLNIESKVAAQGEGGLLSVAFHPQYKSNGKFYVNYTTNGPFRTVVSEFTANQKSHIAPLSSEKVLLEVPQPWANHNGGQIAFDTSGMLLIGMGDGGSGGDPLNAGQDDKTLLGKFLRIDVDNASGGKPYAIPADNSVNVFAHAKGWLPEVHSKGWRNPWRFSRDRVTGTVWVGEVGQNAYEEVDILEAGGNYGWRLMEAAHCYKPSNCNKTGLILPVDEYPHSVGRSLTGGHVYRGAANKSLYGAYIFGDYSSGRFFALWPKGKGYERTELLDTTRRPVTFGEDEAGELYVGFISGTPKLVRVTEDLSGGGATTFPLQLSATKCFTDLAKLTPAKGVIGFDVNAPLWSDGAHKYRHLVLPAGTGKQSKALVLPASDTESWDVPVGTIVIKTFALGDAKAGPAGQAKVETRFMLRHGADKWRFYTYVWRPDGSDADLVLDGAERIVQVPKQGATTWHVPSQTDCGTCHQGSKGPDLLGLQTAQLLGAPSPHSATLGGLQVLANAGLLGGAYKPGSHTAFPKQADLGAPPTKPADLTASARAYMHVQCATCHRPGGSSNTDLDLRMSQPLAATNGCNTAPKKGALGIAGAQIIAPGKPEKSVLLARMQTSASDGNFMPEIGVSKPHQPGSALLKAWITALPGCK